MSDIIETKDSLIQNTINDIKTINESIEQDKDNNYTYAAKLEAACTEEGRIIETLIGYAVHDIKVAVDLVERYRKVVAENIQRSRDRVEYTCKINDLIAEANKSTIKLLEKNLSEKENRTAEDKLNYQLAYLSNLRKNTSNKPILDDIEVVVDALIREFINNNFGAILNIIIDQ